jgi:Trm5-related predicted tRNA methylase
MDANAASPTAKDRGNTAFIRGGIAAAARQLEQAFAHLSQRQHPDGAGGETERCHRGAVVGLGPNRPRRNSSDEALTGFGILIMVLPPTRWNVFSLIFDRFFD